MPFGTASSKVTWSQFDLAASVELEGNCSLLAVARLDVELYGLDQTRHRRAALRALRYVSPYGSADTLGLSVGGAF